MAVVVVVACLFATLLVRLWYLQVADASAPVQQVASEGLKTIYIPAPRGEIFARNGQLLAGNRIEQVVKVEPDAVQQDPRIVGRLAAVLDEAVTKVKASLDNPEFSPYQRVPIAVGVSNSVVLSIDENRRLFPGVRVSPEPVRYYPYGPLTANIVGYVSQITAPEYQADRGEMCAKGIPCYTTTSQVGQAGIESSMEKYLRGTPGKEVVQVNAQGQVLGVASYTPPVPGDNVVLSISLTDQRAAMTALQDWTRNARTMVGLTSSHYYRSPAGAMVVEDPHNGRLLALATYPDYNDNAFVGGISERLWKYYNNPANHYPMEDRPIAWAGATGSTFKLITATAALDYGVRSPQYLYNDTGGLTVGGQFFRDNAGIAAGYVDLQTAITISDDAYFYSLGYDFWKLWAGGKGHPEYLQHIASEYGLGKYTGIQLPGEAPGIVPSQQVFTRQHEQYPKAYPNSYFDPG